MKKLLYTSLFLCFALRGLAQETFVVETVSYGSTFIKPSGAGTAGFENKTFLVTNSLTLSTGFSIKATDGTFHAKLLASGEKAPVSGDKNYVRSEQVLVAGKTTDAQISALEDGADKFTSFQYSDGMGRPMQSVNVKGSLSGKDIVSFSDYDSYGRKPKEFMPYIASTATGQFQTSTVASQEAFYNSPPTGIAQDTRPFTEYQFDGARVTSATGPGQEWSSTSSASIMKVYSGSDIRKWSINGSGNPVSTTTYPANLLVYTESTDVNGQMARSYKDQWGRVVLSEIENSPNDIRTYYAYDIRGNQLAIIPPKAVTAIKANSWTVTTDIRKGLCYTNTFDAKGRLIEKRVPGKEVVYFVYDQWDRLVLSQDGNQRVGSPDRWTFTKYDAFSRPVITGVYETNNSRASLQSTLDSHSGHHEIRNATSVGYSLNVAFPTSVDENDLLAITYYDDYGFMTSWGSGYNFGTLESGFTGVQSTAVKGQTTGSKTRILGTTKWLKAVTYYDVDYQPLKTIVDNHLGGVDVATTEYDYTGQIIKTYYDHTSTYESLNLLEEYEYDEAGRLINTFQTTNGQTKVLASNNVYNEMGNQIERNLHSTDGGNSFLQSVDYRSNIRGWLTSMNNADLNSNALNNDANDLFGMELDYTNGTTVAGKTIAGNFNGNIATAKWQSNNLEDTPKKQIFGYEYDNLNRITSSTFAADNSGNWTKDENFYNTSYTYKDAQGGFDKVTREGRSGEATTATIDDLAYSYYANTNQISKVDDTATDEGFTDGVQMPTEYTYDDNGNLLSDQNAFITGITYNILDKPERITIMPASGTIYLDFTYDAAGNKLKTSVKDAGANELYAIDYVGGIHYITNEESTELAYMLTPEGRILKYGTNYEYEYHLKDHLGNTRLTFGNLHDTEVFLATMEPEKSSTEEAQFVNVNNTRNTANNHTKASYELIDPLNSSRVAQDMTGPGIAIPVAAGDNIRAEVFAISNGEQSTSSASVVGGLLGSVANMFSITTGEAPATFNALNDALGTLAGDWGSSNSVVPEAYLNIVFISNDNLTNSSSFDKITATSYTQHEKLSASFEAPANGVMYIYVANENRENKEVWFDDLLVVHEKTTSSLNVAQANDYYPFGMVMEGTAYNDKGQQAQLYKFNGNEVLEGEGIPTNLNLMNFNARLYNPALGVFLAVDPMATSFAGLTPYNFGLNNPTLLSDPNGECPICIVMAIGGIINLGIKIYQGKVNFNNGVWNGIGDGAVAFGIGAAAGAVGFVTGGAAFTAAGGAAAGAGGFFAGVAGGAVGSAFAMPVQNMGNMAYFNDPMMTMKEYATGILIGGAFGGTLNGIVAVRNGNGFWNGIPKASPMPATPIVQGITKPAPMSNADDMLANQTKIQGVQSKSGNLPTNKLDNVKIGGGDFRNNPVANAPYKEGSSAAWKSLNAKDINHNFSRIVDNYAGTGSSFSITGGDGITRTLYQVSGSLRGINGRFEWLIEAGRITHRQFIPNGTINGLIGIP